ncbi:hypothetical protein N7603_07540 [Acholeplasma vituli]|uniref:Uncharacterized protein n=1 Tax=Paracholeplasma vituli TaxID=69473 RepID=A0ABT2PX29_9MOLU|nr:hypothetical protein [Paracholeplasma vituli]MCU0105509.1 hypothetical protein [Paracholeplasma vituli]
MHRKHFFVIGFILAIILWMTQYANLFYLWGKYQSGMSGSALIVLLIYFLGVGLVNFKCVKSPYKETSTAIALSLLYGVPFLILLIMLIMTWQEATLYAYFFTSFLGIITLNYVLSILIKEKSTE